MTDDAAIPTLAIKWDSLGPTDEFGEVVICERCGEPARDEIGPAAFVVRTWRPVCDRCASREDRALASTMWRIRAELDRGEIGRETTAWLDRLEGHDAELTRGAIEQRLSSGSERAGS